MSKLKCFSFGLAVVFTQSIEARRWVENEDVVGAAPTGDAPTTSEWSTIILPAKVGLILEIWRYLIGMLCAYGMLFQEAMRRSADSSYLKIYMWRAKLNLSTGRTQHHVYEI